MSRARDIANIGDDVATGEVVTTASPSLGRRNLIINGAMQVAQRGTSFGAGDGYKLDRFICINHTSASQSSSSPSGFQNSLEVTGTNVLVRQPIENSYSRLSANTFTVSFYIKGNAAYSGTVDINDGTQQSFSVTTSWQRIVKTFNALTSPNAIYGNDNDWLDIQVPDTSATWQITGVQLEVGSVATPFEHRSYGEELALCQRYFFKVGNSDAVYKRYAITHSDTATNSRSVFHFPVPMRSFPTLTTTGTFANYQAETIRQLTSLTLNPTWTEHTGSYPQVCLFSVVSSGQTAGYAGELLSNNVASSLSFDSEL